MSLILPNTALATAAELAALAQKVATNASAVAAAVTSIQALAAQLGLDEAQIAKLGAAATPAPIIVPPVVPPPYDPLVQWSTGVEIGDLSAWSSQENTGFAASTAAQVAAEGITPRVSKLFGNPSLWVMKQSVLAPSGVAEASGTRMSRFPEIDKFCRAGTAFYYSWWDFFPVALSYGASGWYNHWQIASADGLPGGYHPIWVLGIDGSGMTLSLDWSPNNKAPAGPHAGETGPRHYSSTVSVPVGQWVFFEAMIKPASDFTGALQLWANGNLAFDLSAIKTQFPIAAQPRVGWVANNCYGVGFATPFSHFVDDVSISLGRMP